MQPVTASNGLYLTLDDIKMHVQLSRDASVVMCPTSVVSVENTAHGNVVPLDELRGIKRWAGENGVGVHLDGARVWHAVSVGGARLRDVGACADAMTVSFSKGIGAPIGAMVVGSREIVGRMRRLRQSIGGGVRKVGMLAAAAREAVEENFGPGGVDERGVLEAGHAMARRVGELWTRRGGRLARPVETNLVWLDVSFAGVEAGIMNATGLNRGLLISSPRVVLHHQICEEALVSLEEVFEDVLVRGPDGEESEAPVALRGCVPSL